MPKNRMGVNTNRAPTQNMARSAASWFIVPQNPPQVFQVVAQGRGAQSEGAAQPQRPRAAVGAERQQGPDGEAGTEHNRRADEEAMKGDHVATTGTRRSP